MVGLVDLMHNEGQFFLAELVLKAATSPCPYMLQTWCDWCNDDSTKCACRVAERAAERARKAWSRLRRGREEGEEEEVAADSRAALVKVAAELLTEVLRINEQLRVTLAQLRLNVG